MSYTHQIRITKGDRGDFTYSPSTLNATVHDMVCWTSEDGPFAVSFTDQTPFKRVSFSSKDDGQGQHNIAAVEIREKTVGHHHYAVALAVIKSSDDTRGQPTIEVVMDSGCPDIVVSDN